MALGFDSEGSFGLGAEAGDVLPVVLAGAICDEGRQDHAEVIGERVRVALVERAHFAEAGFNVPVAADTDAFGAELIVKALKVGVREAIRHFSAGFEREDLGEIDEGVAGHDEGELGLAGGLLLDAGDEQSAGVEDGD